MAEDKPLWERLLLALGFNTVRLRWKYRQWQAKRDKVARAKENEGRALRYAHKLCPSCGLTVDKREKRCPRCETALASAAVTRLGRYARLVFPAGSYSYSAFFVAVNVAFYLAMVLQSGGPSALFSGPTNRVALRFGAWYVPLIVQGEWWRLLTPAFLHFGTLHLVFNCLWLMQLGPLVEQLVGRSRYLVLYLATAVGGFAFSIGYRIFISHDPRGLGGGASGVVFGLIGAALVFGYVRRSPGAQLFRDGLIKWALFGIVMSLLPGIDLLAHLGGGLVGGGLALFLATRDQARRISDRLWLLLEFSCALLIVGSFALTVINVPAILR